MRVGRLNADETTKLVVAFYKALALLESCRECDWLQNCDVTMHTMCVCYTQNSSSGSNYGGHIPRIVRLSSGVDISPIRNPIVPVTY